MRERLRYTVGETDILARIIIKLSEFIGHIHLEVGGARHHPTSSMRTRRGPIRIIPKEPFSAKYKIIAAYC